jgi:hypothetical protein
LICRQVDDYAIATKNTSTAEALATKINSYVTTEYKGIGERTPIRIKSWYNGVDLLQTRDYAKIHCETYIDRLIASHGWDGETRKSDKNIPMVESILPKLYGSVGPQEGTTEHKALEDRMGFSFRKLLGELLYAYVTCRFDIGYATCMLARFSTAPDEVHYKCLKDIVMYLKASKTWGIHYWYRNPRTDLPYHPAPQVSTDGIQGFPFLDGLQLAGFVDAAHATDLLTRRSVAGLVFLLSGGAIAYNSKLQPTVATSSTEAEFIAAVSAAKIARYLRFVLKELGFEQKGPTPLFEDNQAAIAMINDQKPTPRSRHIDIQHFAIQEWRQQGDIEMKYVPSELNIADDETKALGWSLHHRHVHRAFGFVKPSWVSC